MKTRSQTKKENSALFEVNIDFDEASAAWKSNKRPTGNGCYKYVCCHVTKTGRKCSKEPIHFSDFCKTHTK
jgi:hypothetical protein